MTFVYRRRVLPVLVSATESRTHCAVGVEVTPITSRKRPARAAVIPPSVRGNVSSFCCIVGELVILRSKHCSGEIITRLVNIWTVIYVNMCNLVL